MKIKSIIIYSHDGRKRELRFNLDGLNIITGRSSTGKSTLSDIIEYCMGESTFNVPEGIIRDKVSWFGVIYQFAQDEVLVAKPTPAAKHVSCSMAMLRRGNNLTVPEFEELSVNSDDDAVVTTLSNLLGIPENRTDVALEHSRSSYPVNIKHSFYYLFQKEGIITNKRQLLYRQDEQFQPQAIRDTLPILLGITSDDRYELGAKLRSAKRNLKLNAKLLEDARNFIDTSYGKGISLLSEAKAVGIAKSIGPPANAGEIIEKLREVSKWRPEAISEEDTGRISKLEKSLVTLRENRRGLERKLETALKYLEKADGFTSEAGEQKDRLSSIRALPSDPETGEWQWPFSEKNLGMTTPIAEALLNELSSLENEMKTVIGSRPRLEAYISELTASLDRVKQEIREREIELSASIAADEEIKEMKTRQSAAARVVGRISYFLESARSEDETSSLEAEQERLKQLIGELKQKIGIDDIEDRLASALNNISSKVTQYIRELKAEFSEYPFRFDLAQLTVIADRPERPITMSPTGGGENHLAYHLAAVLALHYFASKNGRPLPRFLLIDQPSQVYFPSENTYKAADGSIQRTESDADIVAVRKLFQFLLNYTEIENPGFQIIVTEHANLRDSWFQNSLVDEVWRKPPALVPEDWPIRT